MPARVVLAALLALFLVPAAHTTLGQQADLPRTAKSVYGNVESQLSDLVQQAVRGGIAASVALATQAPVSDGDRVAVTIYLSGDPGTVVRALERRDAVVANVDTGLIEAYVDLLDVPDLSDLPGVMRVALIRPPVPLGRRRDILSAVGTGSVVSEAVTVHNAARHHNAGIIGRGVKVGVIDGGFIDLRQIQDDGELPSKIRARCYSRIGRFNSRLANCELDTDHGTAVAEALLDVAPGVALYISNPQSFTDLRRTMRWMANQGVKIINHSVGWIWNGPGDGTTDIANSPLRTVAEAAERGVLWVNAAGNGARDGWSGPFRDRDSDGRHEFTTGRLERNRVRLSDGGAILLQLRWQDGWGGAETDLDLYLRDASGTTVARAVDQQSGFASHIPLELLFFSSFGAGRAVRDYFIEIEHFAGPAPAWVQVEDFFGQHDLRFFQPGRSTGNPAESAAPGVLAVGAANWRNTTAIERFRQARPGRRRSGQLGGVRPLARHQSSLAARRRTGRAPAAARARAHTRAAGRPTEAVRPTPRREAEQHLGLRFRLVGDPLTPSPPRLAPDRRFVAVSFEPGR